MRSTHIPIRGYMFACIAVLTGLAAAASAGDSPPHILLDTGLVVVHATNDEGEDYEVFSSLIGADDKAITWELRRADPAAADGREDHSFSVRRIVERQDIASANRIVVYFHSQDPPLFPGSTAGQASHDLLAALKRGEAAPFILGTASGRFGLFGARKYFRGTLQRVEAESVPVQVLLNGVRMALPAIHVKGTLAVGGDSGEAEFWFLDQDDHAMTLRWTFKDTSVQVIRIDTPAAGPGAARDEIGKALESQSCRAELHGVYFDSGSAVLLPQSTAEISAVAALMAGHPDWRVTVEGHTDAIGSDSDNVALSQARAEAVRSALVKDGVAAERLTATGFGETRPLESNDTLEGRARNRRVELARECP